MRPSSSRCRRLAPLADSRPGSGRAQPTGRCRTIKAPARPVGDLRTFHSSADPRPCPARRHSKHAFGPGACHGVAHQSVPPLRLQGWSERHPQPARAPRADGERAVQLSAVPEGPCCCG